MFDNIVIKKHGCYIKPMFTTENIIIVNITIIRIIYIIRNKYNGRNGRKTIEHSINNLLPQQ